MSDAAIHELDVLDFRDELSKAYEEAHGSRPYDLSHWVPSRETMQQMLPHLRLPEPCSPAPYILPYELRERSDVMLRLGALSPDRDLLLLPTGTSAVAFAAWWLKHLGVKRVAILCPGYFSTFYACEMMGVAHSKIYLRRESGKWS